MTDYRRILLVVDLTEDSLHIGRRARALAYFRRRDAKNRTPDTPMSGDSCRPC